MRKPGKMNGWNKDKYGHAGFGKGEKVVHAEEDLQFKKDNDQRLHRYEDHHRMAAR